MIAARRPGPNLALDDGVAHGDGRLLEVDVVLTKRYVGVGTNSLVIGYTYYSVR